MDCFPKEGPEGRCTGPGAGAAASSSSSSSSGGPNLVAHPRAKSKVWRYFGFDTDSDGCIVHWKRIYCRVCMSQIAYSGNTSNLSYHLEKNHPAEFSHLARSNAGRPREAFPSGPARPEPEAPAPRPWRGGGDDDDAAGPRRRGPAARDDRRRDDLTRAVCDFVCEGLHPVSVVEEPAFRALLRAADPRYAPPGRRDLALRMVPRAYERARDAALAELAGVAHCGVAADLWRSAAHGRAYVTLSAHALRHSAAAGFAAGSRCLKTFEVREDGAAESVTRAMHDAFAEWGVLHKVSGVTADGSPDVAKACSLLELPVRMPCLGRAVSRGVEEAFRLPRVAGFLGGCRRLVEHFRETAAALRALREEQRRRGGAAAERPLVRDRGGGGGSWPATLAMLRRLGEQRGAVEAALAGSPAGRGRPGFGAADWARVDAWVEVLRPFEAAAELMTACRGPAISMVRPVLHMLLSGALKARDADPKEIGAAKEVVAKALSAAYAQSREVAAFLNVATFLDPRYKRLPFLTAQERAQVEARVVEEAKAALEKRGRPGGFSPPPPREEEPECKKAHLHAERQQGAAAAGGQDNPLAAIFCQSDADQSQEELHAQVVEELGNYKSQRLLGLNEDPLLWWSSHAALFPTLPKVLQKYWCVPATSAPCHRLFGPAGAAHAGKRGRVGPPALVDQQVFLYENARGYHDPEPADDDLEDAILWDGGRALIAPPE